jgi:ABC-type transport system involved in cytochrome c biogenesis permease component
MDGRWMGAGWAMDGRWMGAGWALDASCFVRVLLLFAVHVCAWLCMLCVVLLGSSVVTLSVTHLALAALAADDRAEGALVVVVR